MKFDNHDARIRHYELLLERDLDSLPSISLPEGYRFVFYRPGDRDSWIDIEKSAKEFAAWGMARQRPDNPPAVPAVDGVLGNRTEAQIQIHYAANEASLCGRMVFVENAAGEKVATATAYEDVTGRDQSGSGASKSSSK